MKWWKDRDEFAQRWAAVDYNLCRLADESGVGRTTINKWKALHKLEPPEYVNPKGNTRSRPSRPEQPPLVPIVDEQLEIEGDAGLSSDWHCPLICYETHSRFLDDCDRAGLTTGIIAGDLTNQDALAGHEEKQPGAEMEPELEHLHWAMDSALDVFDRIGVTLGNHDRHLARQARVNFDRSIRMLLGDLAPEKLDRITVTARDSVIVHTERDPWLVCHTRSYSRLVCAYPSKLAVLKNMNVAAGHRHHHGHVIAPNGKHAIDLGGLQDSTRLAYSHRYTNDLPEMANGYGLLIDGRVKCPMLYS